MITIIPLEAVPNQVINFTLDNENYVIYLSTRLNNLYISIKKNGTYIVCNRICRNMTYICKWFVFMDIEGKSDPVYEGLGVRYNLFWMTM